jgi:hypothetical protein
LAEVKDKAGFFLPAGEKDRRKGDANHFLSGIDPVDYAGKRRVEIALLIDKAAAEKLSERRAVTHDQASFDRRREKGRAVTGRAKLIRVRSCIHAFSHSRLSHQVVSQELVSVKHEAVHD